MLVHFEFGARLPCRRCSAGSPWLLGSTLWREYSPGRLSVTLESYRRGCCLCLPCCCLDKGPFGSNGVAHLAASCLCLVMGTGIKKFPTLYHHSQQESVWEALRTAPPARWLPEAKKEIAVWTLLSLYLEMLLNGCNLLF